MEHWTFLTPDWTPACVASFQRSDWWLQPCRLAWIKCLDMIHHHEADEPLQTSGRSFRRWWPFTCADFSSAARLIKTHTKKTLADAAQPTSEHLPWTIYVSSLEAIIKTQSQSLPRRYFWAWKIVPLLSTAAAAAAAHRIASQGEKNSLLSAMPPLDDGDLMHAGTRSTLSPAV